jgi:hypothetical protein
MINKRSNILMMSEDGWWMVKVTERGLGLRKEDRATQRSREELAKIKKENTRAPEAGLAMEGPDDRFRCKRVKAGGGLILYKR